MKNNQQKLVLIISVVIGFAMNLAMVLVHGAAPGSPFWGLAVLFAAAAGALLAVLTIPGAGDPTGAVDIWEPQARLMAISGQRLPELPVIDKGTMLYFALLLEEIGELQLTLMTANRRSHVTKLADAGFDAASYEFLCALESLSSLNANAGVLKDRIAALPDDFNIPVTGVVARNMLDDITDVAVVTAGFGLAAGLPVRGAYAEVLNSNLSKANPETGEIDKEPSGKWVKGPNYQAPNLDLVLEAQYRAWASDGTHTQV